MPESTAPVQRKIIECRRSRYESIDQIGRETVRTMVMNETLSYADGRSVPEAIATGVVAEWNLDGILVFFRGSFRDLRYATNRAGDVLQKKTYRLWEDSDVFEIFIGPDAAQRKMYKEFQVAPDGRWIDIDVFDALGTSNHHWYSGCSARSFVESSEKTWISVLLMPWRCFDAGREYDGEWNVNFYRASGKFHGDELLSWAPVGTGPRCFHRPEHFGVIKFLEEKR